MTQTAMAEMIGDREIVVSRRFDAPRELVWRAWTDPQAIAEWWGPRGFDAPPCEIDLRPGGKFQVDLNGPDGKVYPCKGTFREIVEPERIVYDGPANEPAGCGAGIPPNATVTVTFAAEGTKPALPRPIRDAARDEGFIPGWQDSSNACRSSGSNSIADTT